MGGRARAVIQARSTGAVAKPEETDREGTLRRSAGAVAPAELGQNVWLLREPGSGTRSTVLELFKELNIFPPRLTLGSNGAIRESVKVGLGITLISRDAVARELDRGELEELAIDGGQRQRSWHVSPASTASYRPRHACSSTT